MSAGSPKETIAKIRAARDLVYASTGRPDLDHVWCGSCGRPFRECLDLSGCAVAKHVTDLRKIALSTGMSEESVISAALRIQEDSVGDWRDRSRLAYERLGKDGESVRVYASSDRSDDLERARATYFKDEGGNRHERRKRAAENRRSRKPARRRH